MARGDPKHRAQKFEEAVPLTCESEGAGGLFWPSTNASPLSGRAARLEPQNRFVHLVVYNRGYFRDEPVGQAGFKLLPTGAQVLKLVPIPDTDFDLVTDAQCECASDAESVASENVGSSARGPLPAPTPE